MFTLVDRGTGQRYVVPTKSADESTVRLLIADREEESLAVYTDGFRAHEPLEDDDTYQQEAVVHSDGEYVDGDVHVNTCESTGRCSVRGSRHTEDLKGQTDTVRLGVPASTSNLPQIRTRRTQTNPSNRVLTYQQCTSEERSFNVRGNSTRQFSPNG